MEGMRVLPMDGFSRTPFKPKYSAIENLVSGDKEVLVHSHALRLPMNALPVSLNVREKPQKNHCKG